jgi:hypothetical protein
MRARAVRFALAAAPLALAAACAHRTSRGVSSARVASGSTAPCSGPGGPADSTAWERVDAGVVEFCVPRGGEVSGSVWRAPGMRLMWGQGSPDHWDPGVFAYRVQLWSPDPGPALWPADDGVARQFHATIGGRRAGVWRFRQGTLHRAAAEWSGAPRVWLRVETEVANDDELPMRILRSVRFPTRRPR